MLPTCRRKDSPPTAPATPTRAAWSFPRGPRRARVLLGSLPVSAVRGGPAGSGPCGHRDDDGAPRRLITTSTATRCSWTPYRTVATGHSTSGAGRGRSHGRYDGRSVRSWPLSWTDPASKSPAGGAASPSLVLAPLAHLDQAVAVLDEVHVACADALPSAAARRSGALISRAKTTIRCAALYNG